MDAFFNNISHRKIRVTVLATHSLIRSSLQSILETERQLSVLDAVGTSSELLKRISHCKPDVVLICLIENEGKNLNVITDLLAAAPQTKIVVLSSPNSLLDQTEALKLGVSAVVGADQKPQTLLRAIRRTSAGEADFKSKVTIRIIKGNFNLPANASYKKAHYFKSDDLTKRELEVVKMIGLGLSNRDISKKLYIGETTVRQHLSSIYSKLDVEDRLNLAIYAYRRRIVAPVAA